MGSVKWAGKVKVDVAITRRGVAEDGGGGWQREELEE
jgi:hypothetical protein